MSDSKKDFKAALSKLKDAAIAFKDAMTPQKFGKSTLADGTIMEWEGDEPMPGMPAMVMGADGAPVPAPDGEYTLPENGTVVTVEAGVIATVTPSAAVEDAAPLDNKAANTGMESQGTMSPAVAKEITERIEKVSKFATEETEAIKTNLTAMSETFAAFKVEFEAVKAENVSLKEQLMSFSKVVSDAINELGEQPQDKNESEQNFRNENKPEESIQEWRKRMRITK